MTTWKDVGNWIVDNAGAGAALVGSLMVGNVQGAVAAGVALVSSATGTADPNQALLHLQTDPAAMVRLRELAVQDEASIREHIREMTALELADKQAEHSETQRTIRAGDALTNGIQWVRPGHATVSLVAAIFYAFQPTPSFEILCALLALPVGYAGLREFGKLNELRFGQSG